MRRENKVTLLEGIAESGREALSLMRDEVADLLITDWLMPEMSGLELSNSIDAWQMGGPHYTYRLIVTGKESPEALDEAFQGQIDDFIFKSKSRCSCPLSLPRRYKYTN